MPPRTQLVARLHYIMGVLGVPPVSAWEVDKEDDEDEDTAEFHAASAASTPLPEALPVQTQGEAPRDVPAERLIVTDEAPPDGAPAPPDSAPPDSTPDSAPAPPDSAPLDSTLLGGAPALPDSAPSTHVVEGEVITARGEEVPRSPTVTTPSSVPTFIAEGEAVTEETEGELGSAVPRPKPVEAAIVTDETPLDVPGAAQLHLSAVVVSSEKLGGSPATPVAEGEALTEEATPIGLGSLVETAAVAAEAPSESAFTPSAESEEVVTAAVDGLFAQAQEPAKALVNEAPYGDAPVTPVAEGEEVSVYTEKGPTDAVAREAAAPAVSPTHESASVVLVAGEAVTTDAEAVSVQELTPPEPAPVAVVEVEPAMEQGAMPLGQATVVLDEAPSAVGHPQEQPVDTPLAVDASQGTPLLQAESLPADAESVPGVACATSAGDEGTEATVTGVVCSCDSCGPTWTCTTCDTGVCTGCISRHEGHDLVACGDTRCETCAKAATQYCDTCGSELCAACSGNHKGHDVSPLSDWESED